MVFIKIGVSLSGIVNTKADRDIFCLFNKRQHIQSLFKVIQILFNFVSLIGRNVSTVAAKNNFFNAIVHISKALFVFSRFYGA
jgi:hypothetical protein